MSDMDKWINANAHLIAPIAISAVSKLDEGQLLAFRQEVESKRRSLGTAYLAWIFFGLHYGYFGKFGWQILFWLTMGGFGFWWAIDVFRIPGMRKEYYHSLTTQAVKDVRALS